MITIGVEYDNVINLLQGLTIIAKSLVPIIELLPADCTTIVAAEAGAHLGAAVIGGLPKDVTFKKIIGKIAKSKGNLCYFKCKFLVALDPIMPLLETDLFLQLLVGRSSQIVVIHSSTGSYKPSTILPPLILEGASVIFVAPGDLTPLCGVGPSQCRSICFRKMLY